MQSFDLFPNAFFTQIVVAVKMDIESYECRAIIGSLGILKDPRKWRNQKLKLFLASSFSHFSCNPFFIQGEQVGAPTVPSVVI
jgi:hypothetical protein